MEDNQGEIYRKGLLYSNKQERNEYQTYYYSWIIEEILKTGSLEYVIEMNIYITGWNSFVILDFSSEDNIEDDQQHEKSNKI